MVVDDACVKKDIEERGQSDICQYKHNNNDRLIIREGYGIFLIRHDIESIQNQ